MDVISYALSKKVAASAVSGVQSMSVSGQTLTINTKDSGVLTMTFPKPRDGVSVTDIDVNDKNQIVFTMSDGTEITSGVIPTVKGADGKPGKDGDPFTYDDFTKEQLEELKGKDGVSPTVTITESTGRHTISFYDKDGVKSITIKDGSPEDMANYYTKDETNEKLNLKANTSDIPIIPTNLSELNNDENYIKNTAENLTNYYKKTETYSQTEVNTLLANINKLTSKIVTELPSENISESTIYLIEVENQKNVYMQYMYINGSFAALGTTAIDLSNVYTKGEVDKKLEEKADKTEIPTIPTLISSFTNDKGYMTEFTETDPTVPAWAKTENKPSYTAAEVGALPEDTEIPIFINKTVLDGITSEKIKDWDEAVTTKTALEAHTNSIVSSKTGVHGMRYFNGTLQVQNAEGEWIDIETGGGAGTIMPKPVTNATIKNKNAQCIITWQDPDDFVLDGVVLADWKGTKLVISETSFPTNEQDGTLVVDNTEKGKYATDGYTVNNLVNDKTYYFSLFTYSSDGVYNYKQAIHLTGKPSLVNIVTFANGTDEEIKAMIDAHYANKINIKDYWAVGDKRTVHLSAMSATGVGESHREQDVQFAIADFDHDELTTAINGHTEAALTLTQVDCLTENGYMNSSNTNVGGWKDCPRRTWCNNVYFNALPSTIKNAVKSVNKKTSAGNQSSTIQITEDKVFLLSEIEIYGTTEGSFFGEGWRYTYYETASNRYKSDAYWQRSPYSSGSTNYFCYVRSNGSSGCYDANLAFGLAPCLCI